MSQAIQFLSRGTDGEQQRGFVIIDEQTYLDAVKARDMSTGSLPLFSSTPVAVNGVFYRKDDTTLAFRRFGNEVTIQMAHTLIAEHREDQQYNKEDIVIKDDIFMVRKEAGAGEFLITDWNFCDTGHKCSELWYYDTMGRQQVLREGVLLAEDDATFPEAPQLIDPDVFNPPGLAIPEYEAYTPFADFLNAANWTENPVVVADGMVHGNGNARFVVTTPITQDDGVFAFKIKGQSNPVWNTDFSSGEIIQGARSAGMDRYFINSGDEDFHTGVFWQYGVASEFINLDVVTEGDPMEYFEVDAGSNPGGFSISPVIKKAQGIPTLIVTMDDGGVGQYTHREMMYRNGIKPTIFVPKDLIGSNVHKMTVANLQEMAAEGCDIQANGSSNDQAMTNAASVADAIADINSIRTWLADNNINSNARHFCYPFGTFRTKTDYIPVTVTGTIGSDTITVDDATGIVVDMDFANKNFPLGTKVTAVNGLDITLSNTATAEDRFGQSLSVVDSFGVFRDQAGEFSTGKLQAELAANGWKLGRTTLHNVVYSRFGIGDLGLTLPGLGMTLSSSGDQSDDRLIEVLQGYIDKAIRYGSTAVTYWHDVTGDTNALNTSVTGFERAMNLIGEYVRRGEIRVITLDEWYQRDCENPIDPFA